MTTRCAIARMPVMLCCLLVCPAIGTAADDNGARGTDLEQVKREWAETAAALRDYSATQRDAALARAEQTLAAMDRRIEQLEGRTRQQWDHLTQSARQAREDTLRTLRTQRNQAAEWYGAMKHSSASAWDTVRQGFIDSYARLSESFRKAWDEFGDQAQQRP